MEVIGPRSTVRRGSPGEVLEAELESAARSAVILTFGGGTNEVQREIIASLGLGLARAPR
jgi:3-oxocholest-4-en-26-oyl-CoA dehydrogenase alpha subunit